MIRRCGEVDANGSFEGVSGELGYPPVSRVCLLLGFDGSICGIYRRFLDTGSIAEASREKKEALRRDLRPLVDIYEELAK